MLESSIPSTKIVTLSSPEYRSAFQRGSLNSFLPRESRSNQVTPQPSTVTRKYHECLRRVRASVIWPLSLSPQAHPAQPPCPCSSWLHRALPLLKGSKPQGLCTDCSSAYNGPPPNFPVTASFLPFIPNYRLLRGRHHPKKPPNQSCSFTSLLQSPLGDDHDWIFSCSSALLWWGFCYCCLSSLLLPH